MDQGIRTAADLERAAAADFQRRIEEGEDVPLVEDAPLAPEEETPDFQHLSTLLALRGTRANEHWQGNTHITLHVLQRSVDEFVAKERG